jgi:heme/copper-type cytochrome/quinol oxidase subunit 2
MKAFVLDLFSDFAKGVNFESAAEPVTTQAIQLLNNPTILIIAIILIAVTIFILFFLKKVIINSILGGIIWGVSTFIFHVDLPLIPSFVIAVLFGPAGIGAMLLLKFFGLLV